MGGTFAAAPEPAQRVLRAIDIQTGKVAWDGAFAAADARSGKRLWSFQTSQVWKSSPMTDVFDSRQFVAVASGPSILTFALPAASR